MATKQEKHDTIIMVDSGAWRVKVALGLGGLTALVILGFVYRVEAGIVFLVIGLAYAGRIGLVAYRQHKIAGFELRRLEAEVGQTEYATKEAEWKAVKAQAEAYFVQTNAGVFQLSGIHVEQFYPAVSASKSLIDLPQLPAPAPPQNYRRLLDVEFIHLLAVGPSGSGKTTVLCHLIDNAPGNTLIYALDPHAQFGEWPGQVNEIVGDGRDYGAIDNRLLVLMDAMNRRYNGLEGTAQKILIVADEWLSILDRCPHANEFFATIGSEARKVNMSLIISSISATVDDLAVSAAIRDNLAQLTLSHAMRRDNLGELKWGRSDKELVTLPGRYIPRLALPPAVATPPPVTRPDEQDFELPPELDCGPAPIGPRPDELRIFELYREGKSLHAIHKIVYPDRSYGGVQAAELKEVLGRFGVSL